MPKIIDLLGQNANDMKVLPFKIPKTENESFRVQIDDVPRFYDTFHKHAEIQITYISKSEGTLICGDYIGNFHEGDLIVFGSNQPHVIRNNKDYYQDGFYKTAYATSLFFDKNSFGKEFFSLPELENLNDFLNKTQRGLRFGPSVKEKVKRMMFEIEHRNGLSRIIEMLNILKLLSETEDYSFLASETEIKEYGEREGKRMNDIFQFTMQEYYRDITLEEVAEIANLTTNAFCRYFKRRTRKTYINFLNEIRISNACKLLKDKELSVAQICYQTGFKNLSHFNRSFKKVTGFTPTNYWKHFKE